MKPWTELLPDSKVAFMNDIITQVPTTFGAREAFINIIQDIADKARSPTFRFYRVSVMNGEITGLDDEKKAIDIAESEDDFVIDTHTNMWIMADGANQEIQADPIPEDQDEDEDDEPIDLDDDTGEDDDK